MQHRFDRDMEAPAAAELHPSPFCTDNAVSGFETKWGFPPQAAAHEEVLHRFDRDMEALAAAELHPAARSAGVARLLDLLPEAKLRDWAAECGRAHRQFADKVGA